MGGREIGWGVLEVVLVVVIVSILAGALLGQPVIFSFVETDSMEPSIEAGDGFVAIPTPVAGEVEPGDVIVFEAQTLQGGGLTTHRVVEETPQGYVTKGDANPFTDQDSQEPPVTDGQIVAKAWQVNGNVVTIPGLGTVVLTIRGAVETVQRSIAVTLGAPSLLGTQGLTVLLAGIGLVVLVFGWLFDDDKRQRARTWSRNRTDVYDPRRFILALALLVAVASGGTMVALSSTHEYGMVSASFESDTPTTVPQGETSNASYPALNGGQLPVYAFYEPTSNNVAVEPNAMKLSPGEQRNATIIFEAPPETGYYPQYVAEYRYFAVLPRPIMGALYAVHPWLPMLVTSAVMGGVFLVAGLAVLGSTKVKVRSRGRSRDSFL